jgi:hypothetical protein
LAQRIGWRTPYGLIGIQQLRMNEKIRHKPEFGEEEPLKSTLEDQ